MKIKKLPVTDGKRLVGLMSLTDIARFQPQVISILKQLAAKQAAPKSMKKSLTFTSSKHIPASLRILS
jgi:signal-transduction protein with cAMP-binding, CBS, and nucleotidyltransferase domain